MKILRFYRLYHPLTCRAVCVNVTLGTGLNPEPAFWLLSHSQADNSLPQSQKHRGYSSRAFKQCKTSSVMSSAVQGSWLEFASRSLRAHCWR